MKESSNGNNTNVGSIENLIWERDYYKLRFEELNKQWNEVIDEILRKDYDNYGLDWKSCDRLTTEDIIYKYKKCKKRWWNFGRK